MIITKLDVLDGVEEIKVCTAYEVDGETFDTVPVDTDRLFRVKPIYKSFPGWPEGATANARSPEELPENARNYLSFLESFLGTPITIVSVGPDREHVIRMDASVCS
jgi:adenylosuccinate synthase